MQLKQYQNQISFQLILGVADNIKSATICLYAC